MMVEVHTELASNGSAVVEKEQLWYANTESSANEVLTTGRPVCQCPSLDSSWTAKGPLARPRRFRRREYTRLSATGR